MAFFKVYVYSLPWAARWAPTVVLDPIDLPSKAATMMAYARAADGRAGVGATSSEDFFGNILIDPREYMVPAWDF